MVWNCCGSGLCIPPSAVSTLGVTCSNAVSGAVCGANSSAVLHAVSCAIAAVLRTLFLARFRMLYRQYFERFLFVVLELPCTISSEVSSVKWALIQALSKYSACHLGIVTGGISVLSWVLALFRHQAPFSALLLSWASGGCE